MAFSLLPAPSVYTKASNNRSRIPCQVVELRGGGREHARPNIVYWFVLFPAVKLHCPRSLRIPRLQSGTCGVCTASVPALLGVFLNLDSMNSSLVSCGINACTANRTVHVYIFQQRGVCERYRWRYTVWEREEQERARFMQRSRE